MPTVTVGLSDEVIEQLRRRAAAGGRPFERCLEELVERTTLHYLRPLTDRPDAQRTVPGSATVQAAESSPAG